MTGEQAITHQNGLHAVRNGLPLGLLPIGRGARYETEA
jgi:hypothetical protein